MFLYVKKILNEDLALTSSAFMAFSPFSIYFSFAYTESIFFFLMIITFYFANDNKWFYAGIAAALLSGTKVVGVMIVFPLLIFAIKQYGIKNLISIKKGAEKPVLALLMAPLGLFIFMLYLYYLTGDALAFKHIQIAWGREIHNPFIILLDGLNKFWTPYFYFSTASAIGLSLTVYLFYRKKYPEFSITLLAIFIPLSTSLGSMPRYVFTLFPIYIALALLTEKYTLIQLYLLILFTSGLTFMSIAWVTVQWFTN